MFVECESQDKPALTSDGDATLLETAFELQQNVDFFTADNMGLENLRNDAELKSPERRKVSLRFLLAF